MKPFRGKRTGPQSRPGDSTRWQSLLLSLPDPEGPRRLGGLAAGALPRGERRDRLAGGQMAGDAGGPRFGGGVWRPGPGPPADRGTAAPALRGTGPCRWLEGSTGMGLFHSAVRPPSFWRRVPPVQGAQGLRRICRHPVRPVLKHGPRSLTCARVIGLYETHRRNESEGGLWSLRWDPCPRGGAHHRPVSPAASGRRSKSVHVGTRKMVNYA